MGKVRAAKKSRGHYVAKKGTNEQDSVSTGSLETITLHTKKQNFKSSTSKTNSDAGKVPTNEPLKEDGEFISIEEHGTAKKSMSKKGRRAERRQQWMKKLSNYQLSDKKKEVKKKDTHSISEMQSLVDALPSLQEMGQSKKKKVQKFTKKSLDAEINNFVKVLEHPSFKKDPLGTIHLHLTNARKRGLI